MSVGLQFARLPAVCGGWPTRVGDGRPKLIQIRFQGFRIKMADWGTGCCRNRNSLFAAPGALASRPAKWSKPPYNKLMVCLEVAVSLAHH